LADGSHPFSSKFKSAELPMVMVSSLSLERSDAPALMNYLNQLQKVSNVINTEEHWNGFNVLHNDAGRVNALELGITSKSVADISTKAKVVYLLGADNFRHEEIPEDAFVIYQGHTGDEGAYYADLILPTSSYLEK
jgi:NADH dehydrogenase/NADH:ubiquinone oxidoreductase subunit G